MKFKSAKKAIIISVAILAILASAIFGIIIYNNSYSKLSREPSLEECQEIVDATISNLPKAAAYSAKNVFANTKITVKSTEVGNEKNIILNCEYTTLDAGSIIIGHKDELMTEIYKTYVANDKKGNATQLTLDISKTLNKFLEDAKPISGTIVLELYETQTGKFDLFLEDDAINTCTGGIVASIKEIDQIKEVTVDGEVIDISKMNTLRRGLQQNIELRNYDNDKPDTSSPLMKWWHDIVDEFKRNFVSKNQWQYLTDGLLTTLSISGLSALMGTFIGFFVAIIRCTYQTTGKLKFLDSVFSVYLTIMRGTPVMVQLLIIYFVFLLPAGVDKFPAAVLCFGLNSGAYVAEIVRGGIMSVDKGQIEAGRSLGFNYASTMIHVVVPQAFKAILPSLANEFITLLKESSVAFYIGVADLTQGGLKIRSITYSNFMPLIAVALIYLVIVMILTKLVGLLERRLRKSDH